ncbi:MAG: hypothetical protein MR995_02535 [Fusobacterium mortiferum]|uniref:hypothetical protein n=1 Tax=Lactobacillus amylovorus TaxID=1604 RepID=UPI002431F7C7|nr:hypothetical protein [Methanobrevibacter smithii]MCI7187011.1 hypothetical protein [Fusobacterium mortiferum]MCI7356079.1 hypothetical protein [Methanobrevibacter smithii]MDY2786022.1 hypothetical protein [Lactobacillus amylovorus]MDY4215127.1 hypothetical protein [Candidatus Onthovivens sp.]
MRFISIDINFNDISKKYAFFDKTVISSDKNSVGKSTLLRLLFYGLGYPVPGTYKLPFKKLQIKIKFERDNRKYLVYRHNKYLELYENQKLILTESVSSNMKTWFSYIWNINSPEVLDNILGAIYMEQDKGWTLLNRGKVIGNIRFNVRDLLIGLSDQSSEILRVIEEKNKLKKIQDQVRRILDISEITDEEMEVTDNGDVELKNQEQLKELNNLRIKANYIKKKLSKLKQYKRDTVNLKNYIYSLRLLIKNPNSKMPILVSKENKNLLNFDNNILFISEQIVTLQERLNSINREIAKIDNQLDNDVTSLFKDEDVVTSTLSSLSKVKINVDQLLEKENRLSGRLSELNKKIDKEFYLNNKIIDETQQWINKFAKILGITDIVNSKKNYLLTHDLKSISGTEYYKIVFSFKMAYIKVIENHTKTKLPIVLDSPSGREVTQRNIDSVIKILNEYFAENQIILASIRKYDLHDAKYITIKNKLLEYAKGSHIEIDLLNKKSNKSEEDS